jgi:hypothetical protein
MGCRKRSSLLCGGRIWQRAYKRRHSGDAFKIDQSSNVYRVIGVFDFAIARDDDRNPHRSFQSGIANGEKRGGRFTSIPYIFATKARIRQKTPQRTV